jgi:hypothetical protein
MNVDLHVAIGEADMLDSLGCLGLILELFWPGLELLFFSREGDIGTLPAEQRPYDEYRRTSERS